MKRGLGHFRFSQETLASVLVLGQAELNTYTPHISMSVATVTDTDKILYIYIYIYTQTRTHREKHTQGERNREQAVMP